MSWTKPTWTILAPRRTLPLTKTSGRNMREKIGAGILLQASKRVDEINTRRVPRERKRERDSEGENDVIYKGKSWRLDANVRALREKEDRERNYRRESSAFFRRTRMLRSFHAYSLSFWQVSFGYRGNLWTVANIGLSLEQLCFPAKFLADQE